MAESAFVIPVDRLAEPVLLVTMDGVVTDANRAALEDSGLAGAPAARLEDLCAGDGDRLAAFLDLCATSREPLPGALTLRDGRAFRADGCVLQPAAPGRPALICLRLYPRAEAVGRFAALNEKIEELSQEVRVRLAAEAQLTKALAEKSVLIQELHHRIRNTLQVLASLASLDSRRAEGAARDLLALHAGRANAIGLIYRHLYAPNLLHVPIAGFLGELCADLDGRGDGPVITVDEDPDLNGAVLPLDIAVSFALLLHDLIIGRLGSCPGGTPPLRVQLTRSSPGRLAFRAVGGSAAGAGPPDRRLIDRLARQLGADLHHEPDGVRLDLPCPDGA
ncbi:histidine kinase dimerization/phosphoacceptor domain -containing protein [Azospirillum halopraeferens]|uniref:histidine kinase dimerization/phosphoacceptor domain -containing protein n=1 Tax=Azospirillum halopraeferens TaxID=34010 RepID=UPI00146FA279|nr:sensor histidine kinase [Azospirillum halopraeferens]